MDKMNHAGSTALAFVLGGAVGAAAALLLAPHTGAETRDGIARGAQRLRGSGENFAHDVEDKMEAVGGAIESAVSEARSTYRTEREKTRVSHAEGIEEVPAAEAAV